MSFIIQIIIGLLFSYLSGRLLTNNIEVSRTEKIAISPLIGYAVIQLTFIFLLLIKIGPNHAQQCTFVFAITGSLFFIGDIRILITSFIKQKAFFSVYFILVFFVLLELIWPILLAEDGNLYWHSGADDLIRDVYLYSLRISINGDYGNLPIIGHSMQYFAPAYWILFFNESNIVVILLNYLLLLLFMFNGITIWVKNTLNLPIRQSLFVAFLSTSCTFYTASYINYHGGTMMVLGAVFYFLRLYSSVTKNIYTNISLLIIAFFLILSYHIAATIFFVATFPMIWVLKSQSFSKLKSSISGLSRIYIICLLVIFFLTFSFGLFSYVNSNNFYFSSSTVAPYDYPGYRAWELIRSPLIFAFYWGIIPSLVMGDGYPFLRDFYNFPIVYHSIIILSLYFTYLLLVSVKRINNHNLNLFYVKTTCVFNAILFSVFLLILDPYYTYKLMYVTQPLFFTALVMWLSEKNDKHSYMYVGRKFIHCLLFAVSILNIFWIYSANYSIFNRDYNKNNKPFRDLLLIPKDIVCSSEFIVPSNELKIIYSAFYQQNKICADVKKSEISSYLISSKLTKDITYRMPKSPLYENDTFSVSTKDNYVYVSENFTGVEINNFLEPVRQLYDRELKHNSPVSYELTFTADNSGCSFNYIQLLVGPGDSRTNPKFDLYYSIEGKIDHLQVIDQSLLYIPIANQCKTFPVTIFTNDSESLMSLLPVEQRKLSAKILDLQLVKTMYSKDAIKLLNRNTDLEKNDLFVLGSGWSEFESQTFRWSQGRSEFIILNPTKPALSVEAVLEVGPSVSNYPVHFSIRTLDGKVLANFTLESGERSIKFDLSSLEVDKPNRFIIETDNHLDALVKDKRLLAFRLINNSVK